MIFCNSLFFSSMEENVSLGESPPREGLKPERSKDGSMLFVWFPQSASYINLFQNCNIVKISTAAFQLESELSLEH